MSELDLKHKLFNFVCRFDLGFLVLRFSLFIPVLVYSYTVGVSDERFAEFSQIFHTCLFLSGLVIFGFHERGVVVGFRETVDEFAVIGFRALIMLLLVCAIFIKRESWLVISVVSYVIVFRVGSIFGFLRFQNDPKSYFLLTVAVTAMGVSPLIENYSTFFVVAFLFLIVLWFAKVNFARFSTKLIESHVEDAPFATNLVLSSFFMQGSLMVFSVFSEPKAFAHATNFIYLVNAGVIVQSFLYRALMKSFVKRDIGLAKPLLLSLLLACAIIAVYSIFGPFLEKALLSVNRLQSNDFVYVCLIVFTHSLSFVLSSFLVATGNISTQLLITTSSSVVICLFCLIYYYTGGVFEFSIFMALVSFLFCLARTTKVISIVRSIEK